ncbi:hypothetical protein D3C87_2015130 [compost metagenome]
MQRLEAYRPLRCITRQVQQLQAFPFMVESTRKTRQLLDVEQMIGMAVLACRQTQNIFTGCYGVTDIGIL